MKRVLIVIMGLTMSVAGQAQDYMHGSIKKNSIQGNKVDIVFQPTFNSIAGEGIVYLQFSLAIPVGLSTGVTATAVGVNAFASMGTLTQDLQYTQATERVFTWTFSLPIPPATAWTTTAFTGVEVTFSGSSASAMVRMLDLSNLGGGGNSNTYFAVVSTRGDLTDLADFYYVIGGENTEGTYGSGDQFVQTIPLVALPVELLSFSGYKDGNRNQLKWTTSTEQNNKGFEVLRSLDGTTYNSIGFVNSLANGGNSSVHLDYSFSDNAPAGDRQFYRLRQVDFGGNGKLSNIVLIKGDKPTIFTINGMFPNPATTTLNLMIGAPNKDKLSVVVFDMNGKMVMQRSLSVETGSNTLPVDVTALAGGTYMLKLISSNGEVSTAKFVKQ